MEYDDLELVEFIFVHLEILGTVNRVELMMKGRNAETSDYITLVRCQYEERS